jgi:adenylate kinase
MKYERRKEEIVTYKKKGMEKRTFQDIEDIQETQEMNRAALGKAALIPESH